MGTSGRGRRADSLRVPHLAVLQRDSGSGTDPGPHQPPRRHAPRHPRARAGGSVPAAQHVRIPTHRRYRYSCNAITVISPKRIFY